MHVFNDKPFIKDYSYLLEYHFERNVFAKLVGAFVVKILISNLNLSSLDSRGKLAALLNPFPNCACIE
jgi:hypothetical protein